MRIRTAKFVMIPMWVMAHPDVRGNATRIATYAGLRAVAWEAPETEWRSIREVARAVSDVNGLGEEAVRKHLSALEKIGALRRLDDELLIPDDEPTLGTAVGTQVPNFGYHGTQTEQDTLFPLEREEENTPVGTTGAPKGDRNREHPDFPRFWQRYPRKKDRQAAVRAFNDAIRLWPLQVVFDGLEREVAGWRRSKRPMGKIPYPATWLNKHGFLNEPDVPDPERASTATRRAMDAAESQRNEVERAIAAGRHELAWRMVVEKAASQPWTAWWADAEELHDRSNRVISLTLGIDEMIVDQWRALRVQALAGYWEALSPHVGELAP